MWLTNRKAEWKAQRTRRHSLAGDDTNVETPPSRKRKRRHSVAREVTNVFAVPQDKDVSHLFCVLIV